MLENTFYKSYIQVLGHGTTTSIENIILIFVKAHHERQFQLFVETLEALAPWFFFALDHVNYSRWLPIFINDMKSLPDEITHNLHKFWAVQKTEKKFSSIPIDQAHEQNNAIVKGSGGAVGLTEKPCGLCKVVDGGWRRAVMQGFLQSSRLIL